MKEIKAFIHRGRASDVVRALVNAGFRYLSVSEVKGTLDKLKSEGQEYSIELGGKVTSEVKLEVMCIDESVDEAVRLIRLHGRTGQPEAGWVYVSDVLASLRIDEN